MAPFHDLEHILNAIADPIFVKDRQHRWVILNDACCNFIGVDRSALIGKSDYDVFPKSEADVFWEKDELVFETGKENDNNEEFTNASGLTHYINTKKRLYQSPTGEKFIVGCISDLTERHRMQQDLQRAREESELKVLERTLELAEMNSVLSKKIADHELTSEQLRQSQKMEAIGQLAGGIAHDFNNLLNVIIGYGSLIERSPASEPNLQELARHITDAAETAASLTRQLLAFSRKQVLQPEVLEVDKVVHAVGNLLRRLIGEDITLKIKAAADVGCIRVDRGQFEQVIINLAVNARDAMPLGGTLTIETERISPEPNVGGENVSNTAEYVAVRVRDTGKGMEPELQQHIFEPFFTTKEQGKGTGLGLATVYGIVTQSNGTITVQSTPGSGSTFTILLPREEQMPAAVIQNQSEALQQAGFGTVLVVEDQADLRGLLRYILQAQGYTVFEAGSGSEAIEIAERRRDIDLLITDIVMPGMRGWELGQKLSSFHPTMKVLYISGHTDTDLINDGAILGDGILLEKPFRPELLFGKVQQMLKPKSSRVP